MLWSPPRMGLPQGRVLALGLSSWGLSLLALAWAIERPAPLFLNLGAGDAPFARGFRGGWERDGLSGSGETLFHWTEDGSRLEFPVAAEGRAVRARMRLARFAPGEAQVTLFLGGRVIESWSQPSRGWSVRESELGELSGPLMLRFRSEAAGGEALGVALDWVEITGVERIWPRRGLAIGLVLALIGVPVAAGLFAGWKAGLGLAALGAWAGAAAVYLDRLGGLVALAEAGGPALAAVALVGLAHLVLRRTWSEQLEPRAALFVPCAAVILACLALFHPFFYYPDVDTHARFLQAIRADLWTAFDPTEFQEKVGAWTRTIGGRRIAFPYAPFFHLAAWPLAWIFGELGAVKTAAAASLGLTLVLAFALVRSLGSPAPWAILGQVLLMLLPVTTSRLTLALFPTLFGQALEALLGMHLVRRFGHLDGARDAAAATFFLFAAQAAYTGSLFNVATVVGLFAALEAAAGERRRALRLITAYAVSAAAVVLLLYARFLPRLFGDVLPHLRSSAEAGGGDPGIQPLLRLTTFYDALLPLLAALGLVLAADAPTHARRYAIAALAAGALLLGLRAVLPTLMRDAKDVELLALPSAALTAHCLRRLCESGKAGQLGALAALTGVLVFCIPRDVALYAARFVAVGR